MKALERIRWRWRRKPDALLKEGFHEDRFLIQMVDALVSERKVEAFIETGANVGTTARFMAGRYPSLNIYTCEVDKTAFTAARRNLSLYRNVEIRNEASPGFLRKLLAENESITARICLFWLDAHGYGFHWPLVDEIHLITRRFERALVMVDDFRVPDRPEFRFDRYEDQICAFETIQPTLHPREYTLVYPTYTAHTSKHHPLTGVVLITWGLTAFSLPGHVAGFFRIETYTKS